MRRGLRGGTLGYIEAMEQRLEEPLNQSYESSKEFNLDPPVTAEKIVPYEKIPNRLEELEQEPTEIQYFELRISLILFNDSTLEQ